MSGDVQPRKRKDKKRKRDFAERKSEGDITLSRQNSLEEDDESSHGVHSTKMGSDDVHLHVQEDHGTGGHWCAKLLFFILLSVLVGLIGLIIMENRGLADLDTPLSESRYSNYFDGWVEERVDDHEHDAVEASIEEHEEHDEPFEEVEDHSEPTEEDADEADEHDDEDEEQEDEADKSENNNVDDDDDDEGDEEEEANLQESNEPQQNDDDDDEENEDQAAEEEDEDDAEDNIDEDEVTTKEQTDSQEVSPDNDEEEEDEDQMDENSVEIVDNDAQEAELLQEKAKAVDSKEADTEADDDDDDNNVEQNDNNDDNDAADTTQSWASALAVKIGIGLALALVARLVLIKNSPATLNDTEKEQLMKRRLTIATAQEEFPEDKAVPILSNDDDEEEFSEIEIEIEEEIEIEDDGTDIPTNFKLEKEKELIQNKYVPETFEELNALYKSKSLENAQEIENKEEEEKNEKVVVPKNEQKVVENEEEDYEEEEIEIEELEENEEEEEELLDEYEDEEEELEEDEENSDVDDTDLLKRLDAKYGILPTGETVADSDEELDDSTWSQIKNKAGGPQSYDEELDSFERELRAANEEMMRERLDLALNVYTQLNEKYRDNPKFVLRIAHALDEQAEKHRNNVLLTIAIETFQQFLNFGAAINDQDFRDVAKRCIERMRFLGHLKPSLKVHQQIMQRFSNEAWPRNDLAVTYLLMNREAEAKIILKETLRHWPDNGFALVHYGFVLKQLDNDYEQAVLYLGRGIAQESPGTQDSRFYLNYGDALQRLGRNEEALKVYDKATSLGLFPSRYQRSFYNEPNLRAKPIWSKNETTYEQYLVRLERNWQAIKAEGLNLISKKGYFQSESENLRQKGDWKQLELYVRGKQIKRNCQKAPITCALINDFPGARDCRRGQVKFSIIHPGTHVWPHCGPTNCRLRAHLGLVVPQGLRLRVAEKEYSWKEGEFIIFDDSFEHEVWHNGNSSRLVLIVDVWHPDLTKEQREQLTAI